MSVTFLLVDKIMKPRNMYCFYVSGCEMLGYVAVIFQFSNILRLFSVFTCQVPNQVNIFLYHAG